MPNILTTKELTLLGDILTQELMATKKARLYSRTMTDKAVAEKFSAIADNHEKHFLALLELM